MSTAAKSVIASFVFVAVLGGAMVMLGRSDDSPTPARPHVAASAIWKVGDRWTVSVNQDAGNITPDGATSIAKVPYRFHVTKAPKAPGERWTLHITLDGGEGPFAKGWYLQYREHKGVMRLDRVAVGDEQPMEAELASIVLGPSIPYETSYSAPPRSHTVDGTELAKRFSLPPSELPSTPGGATSGSPPASS